MERAATENKYTMKIVGAATSIACNQLQDIPHNYLILCFAINYDITRGYIRAKSRMK